MKVELNLQVATSFQPLPTATELQYWVEKALSHVVKSQKNISISIRFVDEAESAKLNQRYRHKTGPTNVLSFPLEDSGTDDTELGDLIICAPLVQQETTTQGKTLQAHFAHLVIHGVLHLLGYDHIKDSEAVVMETLEKEIMAELGFDNPYHD